jgi:hypothetical protein
MTIFGVCNRASGLLCVRKEFVRDLVGGGDLRRGDTGHDGELSPDGPPIFTLCDRGSLEGGSEVGAGCNWGVVAAESARCIAAADGMVPLCPVILGGL